MTYMSSRVREAYKKDPNKAVGPQLLFLEPFKRHRCESAGGALKTSHIFVFVFWVLHAKHYSIV